MEKLKGNSEFDIKNLENKNEPKLLYRLDKRKPLCVAFDLFIYLLICCMPIIFAIPNFVLDISIFSIILNIVCVYISLLVLKILYSVIFFDYVEIYEDKIIYKDIIGLKSILTSRQIDRIVSNMYCGVTGLVIIFKSGKFSIVSTITISSLTAEQLNKIQSNINLIISKFSNKG